jgi:hypothetical protein
MALMALVVGFLPSMYAETQYPLVSQVLSSATTLRYNPDYWDFFNRQIFLWNPDRLIVCNQVGSYGMLLLLAFFAFEQNDFRSYVAPISFISF